MRRTNTMAANSAIFAALARETREVFESTEADLEGNIRRYARFVFQVAYGVLRNSHDAEDVVQETFLRVHRSSARGIRDMKPWLATIAFRLALDRRRPEMMDVSELELAASESSVEAVAIHRQRLERVHRLIAALPDDLRFPLVLSAIEELNSGQIAEMLGIPESSVRGRIMRARQMLKEKLAAMSEVKP